MRGSIALGGLVVGLALGWIVRGPGSGGDTARMLFFNDWRMVCPADKDDKASCGMTADVVDPRSGTKLAQFALGSQPGKTEEELVISVPLTVLIPPGVGLQIGSDTKTYPYQTCVSTGCVSIVKVDDALLKSLDGASSMALVVTAQNGRSVSLPVSVKGYSEARKVFNNIEARRHSWWRRLWS